jgi:hypothetical protein
MSGTRFAPRTARQIAAEAAARFQAEQRRQSGSCTKDVYDGFNSRRGCELEFGHGGRCA